MKQLKTFLKWLSPRLIDDEWAHMLLFVICFIFRMTQEEKKIALVGLRKFGIFILKFCAVIVPVLALLKLIQIYFWSIFVVLLIVCWAGYKIYKRYNSNRLAMLNSEYMSNMSYYSNIAELILNPIKSLTKWLDFAEPDNSKSLFNHPHFISKGNMNF
ncbi:hypothetical protein [Paenibacillus alba]|uniref:Uncharacterized protein n=1 Tax=Paenibacillus alba TaxID=1197127 RepID=A0ABU6G3K7_9BACL|nr:hypothetical protein [Paenibacillus alba]MEC0227349.1 hypothetical protein [Paenibacillus alba]